MSRKKQNQGQSTVELALLLPILFGLVFWIIKAYHANADKADRSMKEHSQALRDFNHGNSGEVLINGIPIIPGRVKEIIPPDFHNPLGDFGKGLLSLGVSNLFSHMFGDRTNVLTGFAKGASQNVAEQYIDSGFKPDQVNRQSALNAGWVGSVTSDQANDFFRGAGEISGFSTREFIGAGAQGGLVAYASGGFQDERQLLGGAIGGLMYSDSSQNWFESGNEILKGAARGALASAASGLITGKIELSDVAAQAALGGFYTEKVARMLPWAGNENARSSTSFGATNAAVSMLIQQGGKATGRELLLAAATGGLVSGQTQRTIRGNRTGVLASMESAAITAGGVVAISSLSNGNSEAIGRSIYYATARGGIGSGMIRDRSSIEQANTPSEVNAALEKGETVDAFATKMEQRMLLQ